MEKPVEFVKRWYPAGSAVSAAPPDDPDPGPGDAAGLAGAPVPVPPALGVVEPPGDDAPGDAAGSRVERVLGPEDAAG
jgi:hypothetical protein